MFWEKQLDNYAVLLHDLIRDLHTGCYVPINRYHHRHVEAFVKSNLVTRDGPYFRLTRNGRELAIWLTTR